MSLTKGSDFEKLTWAEIKEIYYAVSDNDIEIGQVCQVIRELEALMESKK